MSEVFLSLPTNKDTSVAAKAKSRAEDSLVAEYSSISAVKDNPATSN